MRLRRRSLKLENKCWLYVGLVLALMALATYLWLSLREKTLFYLQSARMCYDSTVQPLQDLALTSRNTGVQNPHPLGSFPRGNARYYWRMIHRDAKYAQNLPYDTFELDALDSFDMAASVDALEHTEQTFSSFAKNLRGPREPVFLRAFLSSLRQPKSRITYRVLLRPFASRDVRLKLGEVLSLATRDISPAVVDAYWRNVEERLRDIVASRARRSTASGFYRESERRAVRSLLNVLQDPEELSALAEIFATITLDEPADAIQTLVGEMSSPQAQLVMQAIREDPALGLEPLLMVLAQQKSRDLVLGLYGSLLRSAQISELERLQEISALNSARQFDTTPQARILASVRARFSPDTDNSNDQQVLSDLQTNEGIDVTDAMMWGLEVQETRLLLDHFTHALGEEPGTLIIDEITDDLHRAASRARARVRTETYRTVPVSSERWTLLNAKEVFQYMAPVRITAECMLCHAQDGYRLGEPRGAIAVALPWNPELEHIGLSGNRRIIAASLAVIILCTLLVLIKVIRAVMISPLEHLSAVADRISQGHLDARSELKTGDEIERFSDAFNTMVQNLRESHNELSDLNLDLDEKIDQLARANLQLHHANRIKSEFLSTVTHELRTPLNSIIGFSDILQDPTRGPLTDKQARYARNIALSGQHLLNLINEILDLARIEGGELAVRHETVSLHATIDHVVAMFHESQQRLSIIAHVDDDVPEIKSDAGKLTQILYNLIGNAVKFTPDGGRVSVSASCQNDSVRITVSDTGIGIRRDHHDIIFEKFRQVDGSATRKYGGIGLGLSIVRELVRLLGGQVTVESEPGRGSVFIVVLPVSNVGPDESNPGSAEHPQDD